MKLLVLIAKRYFFSKRNPSAINIITAISLLGYVVGSMALIILLSALNGFEDAIFSEYKFGDPDIKLIPKTGKVFQRTDTINQKLKSIKGNFDYCFSLEEKAIIKYENTQFVVHVNGVDSNYYRVFNTQNLVVSGNYLLKKEDRYYAMLSEGLVYRLNIQNNASVVELMAPDRTAASIVQTDLNIEELPISAMLHFGEDKNTNTVVVSNDIAFNLFNRDNEYTSILIKGDEASILPQLEITFGNQFIVQNRKQQHFTMYKMFNTEKWFSFALLGFILCLISFSLFGSLKMMLVEKDSDIQLLNNLGMSQRRIRFVFFCEGFLIAGLGSILGLVLGIVLIWCQQQFGWLKTDTTFQMIYPVSLNWKDVALVLFFNTLLATLIINLAVKRR